jgi:hypothetical protein
MHSIQFHIVVVEAGPWTDSNQKMVQIDVGPRDVVWGVAQEWLIYVMPNNDGKWQRVHDGRLRHVSYGESGVWGVNIEGKIFYREGVTSTTPAGDDWKELDGILPY